MMLTRDTRTVDVEEAEDGVAEGATEVEIETEVADTGVVDEVVVVASEAAHHSLVAVAADLWAVMEVVELIEATFFADVVAAVAVVMVEAGERTKSKELCIAPSSSFLLHKWNT